MIIDSVNLKCDNCGIEANHPILELPIGWMRWDVKERLQNAKSHMIDLCKDCNDNFRKIIGIAV